MTGGSHDHPDKYLGVAWQTVRRSRADCPRGRCYNQTTTQLAPLFPAFAVLVLDTAYSLPSTLCPTVLFPFKPAKYLVPANRRIIAYQAAFTIN